MGATFPTRDSVLTVARMQHGIMESPPGSNRTKYGKAFGWDGVAWCGEFVWWVFFACGIDIRTVGITNPQYTPAFFAEAPRAGWRGVGRTDVSPGDILFYDFVAPFTTGGIQHTGIALSAASAGHVQAVEGNTSHDDTGSQDNGGGVFFKTRSLGLVVGAVRPPYSRPRKPIVLPWTRPPRPTHTLKLGMVGAEVAALQKMLNRYTSDKPKLDTDGVFGARTETRLRVYQHRHGLLADGVAGPQTLSALWR